MRASGKKVLLFIDNCPSHPVVDESSHTTVHYLPPQTTSHLQPCDQRIIQSFKRKYRHSLLQQYTLAIKNNEDLKPNILDAMIYTQAAWEKVTAETIKNCFCHAGFISADQSSGEPEDIAEEFE